MTECYVIWDMPGDPDGNWVHIFDRRGVTRDEVEEVLRDPRHRSTSRSTGWPICFGWSSTGRYLAVVYEEIYPDPRTVRHI